MERLFVHRIDGEDRICYVNEEWLAFALENDTPEITRASVMKKPIWDFIEDAETRAIFNELISRVRQTMSAVSVPFRCDSPDRVRQMSMELVPLLDEEVQFNCRMVREEAREPVGMLDPGAARSDELVKICSWCKRIETDAGRWVEIDRAIDEMGLFGETRPPRTTGGICPDCKHKVFGRRGL